MSVFLTIGSVVDVPVAEFKALEPTRYGDAGATFGGGWRSMWHAEKRNWSGVLGDMTAAQVNALRAVVALGAHVTCSGSALGGSVVCTVTLAPGTYVRDGAGYQMIASINLREV
jgi:hypothetical protein